MRHWTPEERQQQAELIHGWKPWKRSTGPKTEAGKSRAAKNAKTKHGMRSKAWTALTRALRGQRHWLKDVGAKHEISIQETHEKK
ncbi:MAG: hypothetical protein HY052_08575 [Proteobacteria bacterium]|nr:hypothetical protein [Pseudomonadota bacterium]